MRAIHSLSDFLCKKDKRIFIFTKSLLSRQDVLISCIAQEDFNMLSDHLMNTFFKNHIKLDIILQNDMEDLQVKHSKKGFDKGYFQLKLLNYSKLLLQVTRKIKFRLEDASETLKCTLLPRVFSYQLVSIPRTSRDILRHAVGMHIHRL